MAAAAAPVPHTYLADSLVVQRYATRALSGAAAARDVVAHIAALQAADAARVVRVVFAAAPSQNETLAGILERAAAVDWARVEALHMDEYVGLPATAPQLFSAFLERAAWARLRALGLRAAHAIDASVDARDPAALAAECARYSAVLAAAPVDVVVLGVGENGHVAFNDPPVADFGDAALVKPVELELACRQQQVNDGCFARLEEVPTHALTLTVPALVPRSARLFCVVPGPTKRAAVTAMLTGAVSTACPASALRLHPRCTLYVDDKSFDAEAVVSRLLPPALGVRWTAAAAAPTLGGASVRVGVSAATGKIVAIEPAAAPAAAALVVGPGLVDLQVNGFAGRDFNAPREEGDLAAVAAALAARGVTTFFPAVISNAPEALEANLAAITRACAADARAAAAAPGIHLEGPFISAADGFRGAHPAAHAGRAPDLALFDRLQAAAGGRVRIVTVAPELEGAPDFVRAVAAPPRGVLVAIGHSAASVEQVRTAVAAGARASTHLGNGAPALLARHPNPIWAQLAEDGLAASVIADGHHLPDCVLKTILRAKAAPGAAGAFLVSDSVSVAGLPPGEHDGGVIGRRVLLTAAGRLCMAENPALLAGSALTLDRAVAHVAFTPGLLDARDSGALAEAWRLASERPSRLVGLPQEAGLAVGAPADVVVFEVADAPEGEGGGKRLVAREVFKAGESVAV